MSLVAFLTGEGRSDALACASPLFRASAIWINNRMQNGACQRLKLFVAQMIGTNDDLHGLRRACQCLDRRRRRWLLGYFGRVVGVVAGKRAVWPIGKAQRYLLSPEKTM